ncbi:MAG: DUF4625 domain-containing protein [Flavobacteriales bacterium]
MNKIIKRSAYFLFAASILFAACKKEDPDTIKPTIGTVRINGVTGEVTASAGSTLSFSINVNDNKALKQVKIDIHDAFDGHGHTPNVPWSSQTIYNVDGASKNITPTLTIPSNAASGPYHVIIYCIDAEGNEAQFVEIELTITQNGQPVFNISAPDMTAEIDLAPGDTLHITGLVEDDVDLTEIHIMVENEDTEVVVYDEEFTLPGATDTQFNFSQLATQNKYIIIPSSGGHAHYHITIKAVDNDENHTIIEQHIHAD